MAKLQRRHALMLPEARERGHKGAVLGWASENPESQARSELETRSALEQGLGNDRLGPVEWQHFRGEDAVRLLTDLQAREDNLVLLAHYARIEQALRSKGGVVILATAPCKAER